MEGVPQAVSPHGDADADLSFEALTFGEDSGHVKKDKSNKKKGFKKDRSGQQSDGENKDKGRSTSSVYVSTSGDSERIDESALLKKLEQFGVVKAYHCEQNFGFIQFQDPSVVDAVVDYINKNPVLDGVHLAAERGSGKGAQRSGSPQSFGNSLGNNNNSLGTSYGNNFGIPFSPSTPGSSFTSPSPASSASTSVTSPIPEKPDTILVLKNLPFSLKQDQLQEILMAMNTTAPQSINLHFDNMGVFRGMAFIKYRSLDDAIKVYESLNGYDVGGRKVRVEYKRKNKAQQPDIPAEWQEEDDLKKLWEQVKDFSNNPNVNEISFTPNLTTNQRKQIHSMAEKLKLTHYSTGEGDLRYICIKKATAPSSHPSNSTSSNNTLTSPPMYPPSSSPYYSSTSNLSGTTPTSSPVPSQNGFSVPIPSNSSNNNNNNGDARAIDIKGRRPRRDSDGVRHGSPGNGNGMLGGSVEKQEYRPRNSFKQKDVASSAPADINMDWRNQGQNAQQGQQGLGLAQSPSVAAGITIAPSRQPRGPDGSKGFSDLYRSARKHTCAFLPTENTSLVHEIPAVV